MADKELTVLLMLEAIDKASAIFEKIGGKLEAMGEAAKDAAAKTALTGDELAAAQVKAEAAANAYGAAVDEQVAAQAKLAEATNAVKASQAEQAAVQQDLIEAQARLAAATEADAAEAKAAYDSVAAAAEKGAASVKASVAEQVASLDALSKAQATAARRSQESADAQAAASTETEASSSGLKGLTGVAIGTSAAVAGIGYESLKAAANFQQATTVLVTSGGETAANIGAVRNGILQLASSTGTATQELTNGMYMIGSAGFVGAQGLTVLKAAAQGAKAENADLGTVSNALTTILKDYGLGADKATASMNQMIAVVQNGKTTTEALAGALSNVLPSAASAKLGFDQVGGALATMTGEGMSAQQAAQDLNHSIGALQNPNAVAVKEMQAMGLNATDLSKNLGKNGLTGTFEILSNAITSHMGKDGLVIQSAFASSKAAAADAKAMIDQMPGSLQKLATAYLNGSVTAKQWRTDLQGLDPISAKLMTQFANTADKTRTFNSLLASGSPAAQTYNAAMSKMMGGTTGLQTALMLTGGNMVTFQKNVQAVGTAGKNAGQDVNGWAEIQQTMNQKLDELKQTAEAAAIQLGTALLPMVTTLLGYIMKIVTPIAQWVEHNKKLAAMILLVVGALATGFTVFIMVGKAINLAKDAMKAFEGVGELLEAAPWVLAIMAIAIAAYLIITHWSTVKKWLEDFWNWLKRIFDDGVNFVKSHVNEVAAAAAALLGPIGMIIGIALEVAKHWDAVKHAVAAVWDWMKQAASDVASAVSGAWRTTTAAISKVWDDTVSGLKRAWDDTGGKVVTAVAHAWDQISAAFSKEWDKISSDLSSIWQSLTEIWNATGGALIALITNNWSTIEDVFTTAVGTIEGIVKPPLELLKTIFMTAFNVVVSLVKTQWNLIVGVFRVAFGLIQTAAKAGLQLLEAIFSLAWDVIRTTVKAAWDVISGIVMGAFDVIWGIVRAGLDVVVGLFKVAWAVVTTVFNTTLDMIKGVLAAFADLLTGKWGKLWSDIKSLFTSVWGDIYGFFKNILGTINTTVVNAASSIFGGFEKGIKDAISGVTKALSDVYNGIIGFFKGAGTWLYDIGKTILTGLLNGAKSAWNDVAGFFGGLGSKIIHLKGPPEYDKVMLTPNGQLIMQGLMKGVQAEVPALNAQLGSITASIQSNVANGTRSVAASASALAPARALGSGVTVQNNVYVTGNTVLGDGDADRLATKVGNRLATTTLPGAGRPFTRL